MTRAAGLWRENAALRERLPALSSVILHISASLDLDTVLAEVVQSACAEVLADLPGGADVGNLFLAEKADGEEFTGDDEEVLARPNRQRRRGRLVEANWQGQTSRFLDSYLLFANDGSLSVASRQCLLQMEPRPPCATSEPR